MTSENLPRKERIAAIIESLNNGMHERQEIIAVSLLAALAGQNAFLLGPPGTAKSLIARRISCAFSCAASPGAFFGYLMHRFGTPEEVFGPVSIKELKDDNYVRKTTGFLPTADFAFLDEIWKAGSAILNTLLTIINEKIFRNGDKEEKVPLKALIAASNETPREGEGLEALYDRFIVRLYVPAMADNHNFVKLLQASPEKAEVEVSPKWIIGNKEWEEWQKNIGAVEVSADTIQVVQLIREKLAGGKDKKLKAYISDRRWQKAMHIVKAAAFFCGRNKTNLADTLLLRHCLWNTNDNREKLIKIVEDAVKASGFSTGQDFGAMFARKDKLGSEIRSALFHGMDIYETEMNASGMECYVAKVVFSHRYQTYRENDEIINIYIPVSEADKKDEFCPVDKHGKEMRDVQCQYDGRYAVKITRTDGHHIYLMDGRKGEYRSVTWRPKVRYKKGSQKEFDAPGTRQRLTATFRADIEKCKNDLCAAKSEVDARLEAFKGALDSPFVPKEKRDIAVEGVKKQLDDIEVAIQDCHALNELASD